MNALQQHNCTAGANILQGKNLLGLYRYLPKGLSDWLILERSESLLLDGRAVLSEEVHAWYQKYLVFISFKRVL